MEATWGNNLVDLSDDSDYDNQNQSPHQVHYDTVSDDDHDQDYCDNENENVRKVHKPKYTRKPELGNKNTYFCDSCNFYCTKQSTMSMHYAIKHRKHNGYVCKTCNEEFPVKSMLQQHEKNHHTDAIHICDYDNCNYKFKAKSSLICHFVRKHMKIAKYLIKYDEDPFYRKQYICRECNKRFNKASIYYHIGICSPVSRYVKC
jgi:hypothetical protein